MKHLILILLCTGIINHGQSQSCLWAKKSNAENNTWFERLAADDSGNVFLAGRYTGPQITFGAITLTNPDSNATTIYLVKYDSTGAVQWARSYGGAGATGVADLAVDGAGNAYLFGNYTNASLSFDSYTLTNSYKGGDMFLTKINGAGTTVWARDIRLSREDTFLIGGGELPYAMDVSKSGHIVLLGTFDSGITFGSIHLTMPPVLPYGEWYREFITEYDTSGNAVWGIVPWSSAIDSGVWISDIAFDGSENIFNCLSALGKLN